MKAITNSLDKVRDVLNQRYMTGYRYQSVYDNGNRYEIKIPVYKTRKRIVADFIKEKIQDIVFGMESLIELSISIIKIALVTAAICSPWIVGYIIESL
jgi:hypothetical protein